MHILATTGASLDDLAEPVDLRHAPAKLVALSFTDSDLNGLTAAWTAEGDAAPEMRFASLRDLRHPMSVDLWLDASAVHAKAILVRVLGGYDWWRYGCDRLAELARERGIALALLPGECREEDERLKTLSTVSDVNRAALLDCFREGGPDNLRRAVRRMAKLAGREIAVEAAQPVARAGYYGEALSLPLAGRVSALADGWGSSRIELDLNHPHPALPGHPPRKGEGKPSPLVPIIFYRSMLLAADVAPIDALCKALSSHNITAVPIFVSSLKDPASLAFLDQAMADLAPVAVITATAFASGAEPGEATAFDRWGLPVFQVVTATTRREAWADGPRGLAPADLAMHVVLPELDGRILAGAISFKERGADGIQANRPELDRVAQVAARIAAHLRLQSTPREERRIAVLIPDYPSAPGRTGYAVGLDVPASVLAMLHDLKEAGYAVENIPETPRELMRLLEREAPALESKAYIDAFAKLPELARNAVLAAWGEPAESFTLPPVGRVGAERRGGGENLAPPTPSLSPSLREASLADPPHKGEGKTHFPLRFATFGNVTVALAPDRGRSADRRADYHDPALPPRHELIAFGIWLRETLGAHALVHVGAHGTLEWLPGKTVALSQTCFPEIVAGALPVIYPFIVSNPGEAAQAKRRIAAVTIGHLTPPMSAAGLSDDQQALERLVDEYAQADGLDRRRRDRLAKLIVETAARTGLAGEAGVSEGDDPDGALRRIDAWLCDLKDFAVKDGLHIYGRDGSGEPIRTASADSERAALLAAMDGRRVAPGPSGAPARGRADVLPTGRNLFTVDPRTLPTATAFALGKAASDEVVRSFLQEHGDWPRALVLDLWGSASLRTGGEEIAQGLALMGCRPQWDSATGRVTGIEVLPPASFGRPRVDVTFRISGLFRDMFPTQITLIDAAVAAVAARSEDATDNPLAHAGETRPARIFGSAPGTYGSGIEERLASGDWSDRAELGRLYLESGSHSFGGAESDGSDAGAAFTDRVRDAELLLHASDDPGRDILEGSADVAFVGGFAAAVAALGGSADLVMLDTTDPRKPRARSLADAVTRTVRARALNPRFIAGQMRHGPRGAAEFAETVDRLVGFAETTGAIPPALIEALHEAYLGDPAVRFFLLDQNPAAARAIAERFASARRRGLWHPLRNSIDDDLASLIAEARSQEIAA